MGQPDQFAKRTFAQETARVTRGAVTWEDPPEISLVKVQGDGLFLVRDPRGLAALAAPWPEAFAHEEILLELKMPGDHLDIPTLQRALLRRQARQVERVEAHKPPWRGEEPLWLVAPHLPEMLAEIREVVSFAPGCYRVGPSAFSFLWIAANELALREELIPFLVARSGRALEEFGRWVVLRRPVEWVLDMVEYTAMSTTVREELLRTITTSDDPEVRARQRHAAEVLVDVYPEAAWKIHDEGRNEGQLATARTLLRRVLAARKLAVSADEDQRIAACTDLAMLERWVERAATSASADEALR